MASRAHDFDDSNPAPDPTLDPLQNPLLGKNIHQWARVYFTTPPEERDEAIMNLVRELEAQDSEQEHASPSREECETNDANFSSSRAGNKTAPVLNFGSYVHPEFARREFEDRDIGQPDEDRLEESLSWESSSPTRYRLYAGLLLLIAVAGLGYMGWRTSQSGSAKSMPAPTPISAEQSTNPAQPSQPNSADGGQNSAASQEPSTAPLATTARNEPSAKTTPEEPSGETADPADSTPSGSQAAARGNGSEELAIAKRYLDGTGGKARDTEEARKWLWEALGKHNSEAAELLATLYLQGDGVPKSCDQARVLLDAAARRGVQQAGEQLRHLQDFGCQ